VELNQYACYSQYAVLKQRSGIVVYQAVTMNNELNTRTQ
jgi:hypothetical protein